MHFSVILFFGKVHGIFSRGVIIIVQKQNIRCNFINLTIIYGCKFSRILAMTVLTIIFLHDRWKMLILWLTI